MWKKFNWLKKTLIILSLVIIAILIAIPKIAKSYINNKGGDLLGRNIKLSSLSINYLKGAINLGDLLIYEENAVDTFLFVDKFHANPNVIACVRKEFIIRNIKVEGLDCKVVLNEDRFNFDSLIESFSPDTDAQKEEPPPVHYGVKRLSLIKCKISYSDQNLNSYAALKDLNIGFPSGLYWDNPDLKTMLDFGLESGGKINSELNLNTDTGIYSAILQSQKLEFGVLLPYLQDFMNTRDIGGALSTDLRVNGKTKEASDIDISGTLGIENVYINDTLDTRVMGLGSILIDIDSLNPAKDLYELNSVNIESPYLKYEAFSADDDNISRLLISNDSTELADNSIISEKKASNIFLIIKNYVVDALQEIKASNFSADSVSVTDISVMYTDHNMMERFDYFVSETDLIARDVSSDADSIEVALSSLLNETGNLTSTAILHPKKPEDVKVKLAIDNLIMKDLSPYFLEYLAFPITKGTFKMKSRYRTQDQALNFKNDIELKTFTLGKKQKHKEALKLPVKMAVAMLKDRHGDIHINVPVVGDLSDPKFKIWKQIGSIFTELVVKAASTPYKVIAEGINGADEESTRKITTDNILLNFEERDYKKLDNLAKVLLEKPEIELLIDPYYDIKAQSKVLAMVKAKAGFLSMTDTGSFTVAELQEINSVSEQDSLFVNYVDDKTLVDNLELSLTKKALKIFDIELLNSQVQVHIRASLAEIHERMIAKGVLENQLRQLISPDLIFHSKTDIKDVQYNIMFDVKDE